MCQVFQPLRFPDSGAPVSPAVPPSWTVLYSWSCSYSFLLFWFSCVLPGNSHASNTANAHVIYRSGNCKGHGICSPLFSGFWSLEWDNFSGRCWSHWEASSYTLGMWTGLVPDGTECPQHDVTAWCHSMVSQYDVTVWFFIASPSSIRQMPHGFSRLFLETQCMASYLPYSEG